MELTFAITQDMADKIIQSHLDNVDDYELTDVGHVYTLDNGDSVVIPASASVYVNVKLVCHDTEPYVQNAVVFGDLVAEIS